MTNFVISENNSEHKLAVDVRNMFGAIRRDHDHRLAQIACMTPKGSEWVDLTDYRYGMSDDEIAADVVGTGITQDKWEELRSASNSKLNREFTARKSSIMYNG